MADSVTIDIKGRDEHLRRTLSRARKAFVAFGKGAALATVGLSVVAAASVFAVAKLGAVVLSWGKKLLDLAAEQEKTEQRIASVVRATGEAAGFTAEQMLQLASAMQEVSTSGDEVNLNAMAILATFKNIRGEVFKDALIAMLDMSEVLGSDLPAAALQLGKSLNDPIKGVTALARVGVAFTGQQKEMIKSLQDAGDMMGAQRIILAELEGQMGGAAADAAKTFTGRLEQLWNRLGDVGERLANAFIPTMEAILPLFEVAETVIGNLMPTIEAVGKRIGDWLVEKIEKAGERLWQFAQFAVQAFSVVSIAVTNWRLVLELGLKKAELLYLQLSDKVRHIFTGLIPSFINFAISSIATLFETMNLAVPKLLSNIEKNISKSAGRIQKTFDAIDPLSWLTNPFGKTIELGEALGGKVGNLGRAGGGFSPGDFGFNPLPSFAPPEQANSERQTELATEIESIEGAFAAAIEAVDAINQQVLKDLLKALKGGPGFDEIIGDPDLGFPVAPGEDEAAEKAKAGRGPAFEGLEALNRRITLAAAGGGRSPEDVIVEGIEKAKQDQIRADDEREAKREAKRAVNVAREAEAAFRRVFGDVKRPIAEQNELETNAGLLRDLKRQGGDLLTETQKQTKSLVDALKSGLGLGAG